MQLGLVGLGRMGANMARRLARGGVQLVGVDSSADARAALAGEPNVATVGRSPSARIFEISSSARLSITGELDKEI